MPDQHEDPKDGLNADGLLSRINHPILGAFIATWIVVNWKPIYMLIRGFGDPSQTIDFVIKTYFTNQVWNVIYWPSIYTALFLVFGPLLKDFYGVLKKWSFAFANKWEPIIKTKYKADINEKTDEIGTLNTIQINLSDQLAQRQKELDIYKTAYQFTVNNKAINTGNGFIDVAAYIQQFKDLQSQVNQLNATNSKVNLENLQLRAEVENLKLKSNIIN